MKIGRYNVGVGLLIMAGFMLYGFLLIYLRDFAPDKEAWVASYSVGKHFEARLAGLLMPAGILGEVYLGLPPIFVLLGAVAMTASVVLAGVLALKHWGDGTVSA